MPHACLWEVTCDLRLVECGLASSIYTSCKV